MALTKTPAMVEKELLMHAIAYNMIRALILESASVHQQELGRISFKGAVDLLRQWLPQAAAYYEQPRKLTRWHEELLEAIASVKKPLTSWTTRTQSQKETAQILPTADETPPQVPRNPPPRTLPRRRLTECHSGQTLYWNLPRRVVAVTSVWASGKNEPGGAGGACRPSVQLGAKREKEEPLLLSIVAHFSEENASSGKSLLPWFYLASRAASRVMGGRTQRVFMA
jgi:hypothetical protein